jgi:hypothetical protein
MSRFLACACHRDVDLVDMATGKLVGILPDHAGPVQFIASGDGNTAAAIVTKLDDNGCDSEVVVWDVRKRAERARLRDLGYCSLRCWRRAIERCRLEPRRLALERRQWSVDLRVHTEGRQARGGEAGRHVQAQLQDGAKREIHARRRVDRVPREHAWADARVRGGGEEVQVSSDRHECIFPWELEGVGSVPPRCSLCKRRIQVSGTDKSRSKRATLPRWQQPMLRANRFFSSSSAETSVAIFRVVVNSPPRSQRRGIYEILAGRSV